MLRITLPLAGLFYGVHLVLSLTSGFLFHRHRHQEKGSAKNVNLARNVLFLLVTVQWFLLVAQTGQIGDVNYGETTSRLAVASFVLFLTEIGVANIVMVYRLWIVGSLRHRIIAIPLLSVALLGATACVGVYARDMASRGVLFQSFASPPYGSWLSVALAFSAAINLYCTGYIAWRILSVLWQVQEALHPASSVINIANVSDIVLESISVASAISIITFVTYVCQSRSFYLLMNIAGPTMGSAFCTVAILSRLGGIWPTRPRASKQSPIEFHSRNASTVTELYDTSSGVRETQDTCPDNR